MEVLTRPPPHQDAPIDLSTTTRHLLSHNSWSPHAQVECSVEPRAITKPHPPSRYIPIPKKRHFHVSSHPQESPKSECQSPSTLSQSSNKSRARPSLSPESSRKRPRLESPKPSDLRCDSPAQPQVSSVKNYAVLHTSAITVTTSDSSCGIGERPGVGAGVGLPGSNGEVIVAGKGVTQSVMKPRQRGHSSSAESSYDRSPSNVREDDTSQDSLSSHFLSALLQMQNTGISSQGMLPAPLKDTEALLSAVHHSQMLYYSYCSQLINTLRAKQQLEQQQHHPFHLQHHHHHLHNHQLTHYPHHQEQHQEQQPPHHLHQHRRLSQQKQPRNPKQRQEEHHRVSSESEVERRTPLEEGRSYDSEDTEEDLHTPEDNSLSILRTRLNNQESQQLYESQSSPLAESPSGILPSSTTGGEEMDLSHMEASGGTRKRAPRALTGKHVRPGTGASASTLISLRQKLQERQKIKEVYGVESPQPTKSGTKVRGKKR